MVRLVREMQIAEFLENVDTVIDRLPVDGNITLLDGEQRLCLLTPPMSENLETTTVATRDSPAGIIDPEAF
jgi:hypothetical protein